MRVLIDTQIFLWMAAALEKLSPRANAVCASEDLVLSVASVWEISIKNHIGGLNLRGSCGDYVGRPMKIGGLSILPIQFRHAVAAGELPSTHKDPFDRIIAAQCMEENLPCVTKDGFLSDCGVETIW